MFYVLGLKHATASQNLSPYQVGQQLFISDKKGFDAQTADQIGHGFAVQGPNSNMVCLYESDDLESARDFIVENYDVFPMELPKTSLGDFVKHLIERYGVRNLSKGDFAIFDFSPPLFGGNPYRPIHLVNDCEVLIVSDKKKHITSEYMKAAIKGSGGDVDDPSLEDLERAKNSLKEIGFDFESHHSKEWCVTILVGKEPKLV